MPSASRHQALRDDAAQRLRERDADLLLLVRREEVDDAVDRLGRVDGVQRRQDEVAGLGGGQGRADGLDVTHLADEDDVGVLAHRGTQRDREVGGVLTDLALGHDRLLVLVQDLDRVLDGDDVDLAQRVDEVDHRRQRRRLARAGGPGHQHQAARLQGQLADDLGQRQLGQRLGAHGDPAEDHAVRAARLVGVDAEPADTRDRVGEVRLVVLAEGVDEVVGQDLLEHALGVRRLEVRDLQLAQPPVDAHARRGPDLAVQVGAARAREGVQERDHGLCRLAHALDIGRRRPALEGARDVGRWRRVRRAARAPTPVRRRRKIP